MEYLAKMYHKIRESIGPASFTMSLLIYCTAGIAGAAAFTQLADAVCGSWLTVIADRCQVELPITATWHNGSTAIRSENLLLLFLEWLTNYGVYFYFLIAIILAVRLYHKNRVRPILSAVSELTERALAGEVSQPVSWQGKDELGQVCIHIEEMRKLLALEKKRQWDAWEEQRRINAAFAHDIRTPLTVIRGYTEFLEKYLPQGKLTGEQVLEKLAIIREQEERLFAFSKTMTAIQTLEKRVVLWEKLSRRTVYEAMEKQLEGIRRNTSHQIFLRELGEAAPFYGDMAIMLEVMENLLDNALRYAASKVEITAGWSDSFLNVYVRDDGPGFTGKGLLYAVDAYYREEDRGGEHFGLGLAISRILCERHGGTLTLVNSVEGGAIVTAVFRIHTETFHDLDNLRNTTINLKKK